MGAFTALILFLYSGEALCYRQKTESLADYYYTWAMTGQEFLTKESGVCCDVANLAAYLLQYDYEELGWIYHHGSGIGHVYNYVYEDGYYYIFDLTAAISDNQQNPNRFSITQVENLEDYTVTALCSTDAERVLGIIAVSSLNHTEQPANYMPYMSDDSICFKGKTCAGFEEGVPTQVLYINPEAEGMFEYVTIPHEEIPDKVPSWFREVDHDREKWNLY